MKRILIFSVAYYPAVGGAEVAVKEITDRIAPTDIEFHMLTLNLSGREAAQEKIGNVMVHRIGRGGVGKYLFPFFGARKALALHKKFHFDATWSIMASYNAFAALFFTWFRPNVPFILTLQEGDPLTHIKRRLGIMYPLYLKIFRRATVVQTISAYLADMARSLGATAPVHVIPNGVDLAHFTQTYDTAELATLTQKLGKKTGDVFLITTSRLVLKNGVDTVIKALPLLPEHIHFLVLGTGPLEAQFKKLAHSTGVESRTHFLGFVPHSELPKYLKISDVFIRPSRSEGMGNSFIEAMAAGIPVIATPVGGIPEFLHDRKTGLLCAVGNPASVASAVKTLVENSQLRDEIVARAAALARETYDWNRIAAEMEQKVFSVV